MDQEDKYLQIKYMVVEVEGVSKIPQGNIARTKKKESLLEY